MSKKRRSGQKRNFTKAQQKESFQDLLLNATLNKFKSFITSNVKETVNKENHELRVIVENLYVRLRVLEELVVEKFEDVNKDLLSLKIVEIEDSAEGYELADAAVKGGRVRIEIATKANDQTDFQGSSRLVVDDLGSGNVLGKEIESQIIGIKNGEEKEFTFGEKKKMTAKVLVNRASAKIEETKNENTDEGQESGDSAAGETVKE